MAIHRKVFYSPDRRWRITADPAGTRLEVEYDGQPMLTFTNLQELQDVLAAFGIDLADLVED